MADEQTAEEVVFELRAAEDGHEFEGGSFALPGGETFDIGEALSGNTLSSADPYVISELDRMPAFKREGEEDPVEPEPVPMDAPTPTPEPQPEPTPEDEREGD